MHPSLLTHEIRAIDEILARLLTISGHPNYPNGGHIDGAIDDLRDARAELCRELDEHGLEVAA